MTDKEMRVKPVTTVGHPPALKALLEKVVEAMVGVYGRDTMLDALGGWRHDEGLWRFPLGEGADPMRDLNVIEPPPPWELTSDPEAVFGAGLTDEDRAAIAADIKKDEEWFEGRQGSFGPNEIKGRWQEHEMTMATGKPSKVDAVMASAGKKDTEYRKLAADDEGIRKANEPWAKVYGRNPSIGQEQPAGEVRIPLGAADDVAAAARLSGGRPPQVDKVYQETDEAVVYSAPPEALGAIKGWNGKVPLKKWLSEHPDFAYDKKVGAYVPKENLSEEGAIPEPLASRIELYNKEREEKGWPRLTPHQTLLHLAELRLSLEPPKA